MTANVNNVCPRNPSDFSHRWTNSISFCWKSYFLCFHQVFENLAPPSLPVISVSVSSSPNCINIYPFNSSQSLGQLERTRVRSLKMSAKPPCLSDLPFILLPTSSLINQCVSASHSSWWLNSDGRKKNSCSHFSQRQTFKTMLLFCLRCHLLFLIYFSLEWLNENRQKTVTEKDCRHFSFEADCPF